MLMPSIFWLIVKWVTINIVVDYIKHFYVLIDYYDVIGKPHY